MITGRNSHKINMSPFPAPREPEEKNKRGDAVIFFWYIARIPGGELPAVCYLLFQKRGHSSVPRHLRIQRG